MHWKSLHSFYNSDEWATLKATLLLERGDICECGCGQVFKGTWDCIPHHIQEITTANVNDTGVSLNPDNLLLLRHRCHNQMHKRFGGASSRKVYIVYGPPRAGKNTFVEDAMSEGDLLVDIDRIWFSIGGSNLIKPKTLNDDVFALRNTLLDRVAMRSGKWPRAWVVGGYPLRGDRERVASRLGAELILKYEPKDICIERCGGNHDRERWVRDWFDRYQE